MINALQNREMPTCAFLDKFNQANVVLVKFPWCSLPYVALNRHIAEGDVLPGLGTKFNQILSFLQNQAWLM